MSLKEKLSSVKKAGNFVYGKVMKVLEDDEKISRNMKKVENALGKFPGGKLDSVADTVEEARIYVLLVRDYMYKEYTDIKKRSIAFILFGFLYTASPIDLIPDSAGILGLIDDAAVLKLVDKLVDEEVDKYKEWRVKTGRDEASDDDEEDDD